jgi:DNA modification methylase
MKMPEHHQNSVTTSSVCELIENKQIKYHLIAEFPVEDLKDDGEWLKTYSDDFSQTLKGSIENAGLLSPLVIDVHHRLVDGRLRKKICCELEIKKVPVIIINVEGSVDLRIHLNQYRQKTAEDRLFEVRNLFKKYPNRQGYKNTDGTKYDRYELIRKENLTCYKDDESLKKLEFILNNDIERDVIGKAVINNTVAIELGHELIKLSLPIDRENNYGYEEQLKKGKITVAEANKYIKDREKLNCKSNTFIIPEHSSYFLQDSSELKNLVHYEGMVQTLITSVPFYHKENYVIGGDAQLGHEKTVKEYTHRLVKILTAQLPLFKKSANLFINITDTYVDGLGLEVPSIFQETMRNESPYKFKQQIYILKNNPKPHGENVKRPYDSVEVFLWYVIDGHESKYIQPQLPRDKESSFQVTNGPKDVDMYGNRARKSRNISKPYLNSMSHWSHQDDENFIRVSVGPNHQLMKISQEGHPCPMNPLISLRPILMTTDENDLVYDCFAGTNMVGQMATLLNRRYLGIELNGDYFGIGCEVLRQSNQMFDREALNILNSLVYGNGLSEIIKAA